MCNVPSTASFAHNVSAYATAIKKKKACSVTDISTYGRSISLNICHRIKIKMKNSRLLQDLAVGVKRGGTGIGKKKRIAKSTGKLYILKIN